MGATNSEMGAPGELLSIFLIYGLLLGSCLSEQACVDDACFDQSVHQLKIERSRRDPESGLKYKERSTDLVTTTDMIGVCLPGVNPKVLANTFLSCSNGKVEEVCTMVKRGWLEDKEGKSVVNENVLLATFKDLNGGEEAVRECLQIPEVYEYYEYYYYDYEDYFDDYLEESASENRQRRAAGEERQKGCKGNKGKCKKKDRNSKRRGRNSGEAKCEGKNKEKCRKKQKKRNSRRQKRKDRNKGRTSKPKDKQAKKDAKKQARKEEKQEKKEKIAGKVAMEEARKERKEAKKEENAEKEAQKNALSKLGLKK